MFESIYTLIASADFDSISSERKTNLQELIHYIDSKRENGSVPTLNFICTHNSRRSQFSQLWAKVAADFYGIDVKALSGGVEVTEFNYRAVNSLQKLGFSIEKKGENNPVYTLSWGVDNSLKMFSKMYDDESNDSNVFAAIMTCSHADENCPIIHGCEERISLRFEDPKAFDDTPLEAQMYMERSLQICTELAFVFSKVKK